MILIRYHSFYHWHTEGSYSHLLSDQDGQYLEWIRDFNRYDLYTKSDHLYDLNVMRDYYEPIAEKYLGSDPIYW